MVAGSLVGTPSGRERRPLCAPCAGKQDVYERSVDFHAAERNHFHGERQPPGRRRPPPANQHGWRIKDTPTDLPDKPPRLVGSVVSATRDSHPQAT
jgi:hypothetical protein